MSWLLTLIILSFPSNYHPSEARSIGNKKLPSALVVGTVYCDKCSLNHFSKTSHFISGALVAVECNDTNSKPSFCKEVQTNKHGEFKENLPFSFSKHVEKIQECSMKLISSSEAYCSVASTTTPYSLHLKSRKPGTQIFSGLFTFKPLTQPNICNQKPSIHNSKKLVSVKSHSTDPAFAASLQVPPAPTLHHINNFTPIPELPRLPPFHNFLLCLVFQAFHFPTPCSHSLQ